MGRELHARAVERRRAGGVGVAAVVAVASLSAGVREAVRGQARELLAADLVVRGRRPAPEAILG